MYRVALSALLVGLLAACSLGSQSLPMGFNDGGSSAVAPAASPRRSSPVRLDGDTGSLKAAQPPSLLEKASTARGDDRAPRGTFEKAPSGALADRDYGGTRLDAERARDLINAYRKEKGLKPLKLNVELTNAAKAHSKDLAKWDRISHFGSDGSNPWDRVKRAGYSPRTAAENVGTGQASIEEVLRGWQKSAGHDKNLLLADAEHMGVALVQDQKTDFKTFWTLVVGAPM